MEFFFDIIFMTFLTIICECVFPPLVMNQNVFFRCFVRKSKQKQLEIMKLARVYLAISIANNNVYYCSFFFNVIRILQKNEQHRENNSLQSCSIDVAKHVPYSYSLCKRFKAKCETLCNVTINALKFETNKLPMDFQARFTVLHINS